MNERVSACVIEQVSVCVFGFQYEVGPVSAVALTTPGFPLHKDHACTGHALLTRGHAPQAFGTIPATCVFVRVCVRT